MISTSMDSWTGNLSKAVSPSRFCVKTRTRLCSDRDLKRVSSANNVRRETDLTERELEVLESLVQGERNKEIALRLGVSERTVRAHLSTIYLKLNVDSRAQAVVVAIEHGLIPPRA